ncbi:23S rRNA (guanosine(2251)-2'-O)-methyltransferase RlmB [Rapidithrix thailandica]|uniref:23S rRNA (Guanosine(2251)-2'-O)-methyltransferase RlmB n=1 Tax=Rapidithrix thailandica TaxID=413964 RepID=A0AAW9RXK9_9BACT
MKHQASSKKGELIYGVQPVLEAIEAGKELDKIMIQRDSKNEQTAKLLSTAAQYKVPVVKVPQEKLNKITRKNHQGVVAYLSAISYASLDNVVSECFNQGKTPLILVLDRVTDVRNFGAIARTAECMGVDAIVVPARGAAQIGSDALKTSAGALNYIPVCREQSLLQTVKYLKNSGLEVAACTEKGSDKVFHQDFRGPLAIVMGSEEDGISDDLIKVADFLAEIPMYGKINSLNVSVATSMILYEVNRQRHA